MVTIMPKKILFLDFQWLHEPSGGIFIKEMFFCSLTDDFTYHMTYRCPIWIKPNVYELTNTSRSITANKRNRFLIQHRHKLNVLSGFRPYYLLLQDTNMILRYNPDLIVVGSNTVLEGIQKLLLGEIDVNSSKSNFDMIYNIEAFPPILNIFNLVSTNGLDDEYAPYKATSFAELRKKFLGFNKSISPWKDLCEFHDTSNCAKYNAMILREHYKEKEVILTN